MLVVSKYVDEEMEDEFNRWFDTEHVPERLEVPGIVSAPGFRSEEGSPLYLFIYEPDDVTPSRARPIAVCSPISVPNGPGA